MRIRQADESFLPAAAAWRGVDAPRRILAIRVQATGDVAITLPYLLALGRALPNAEIDFVTRTDVADLPAAIQCFGRVYRLGGGRGERSQLLAAAWLARSLRRRAYDVVLDLQNNRVSGILRRMVQARAWATFDRHSPVRAGERTRRTIEAAGFALSRVEARLPLVQPDAGVGVLSDAGWTPERPLLVLSPAGAFPTRNWPLESYVRFAHLWLTRHPCQVVVVGLAGLRPKAAALKAVLGANLLDLTGRTTLPQALGVLRRAALVLTEDCGLMHMAWTSGVPTLALFGSSPHVWSAPMGPHTACLHSGDLPCGACMEEVCRFGDVRCLVRHRPEDVANAAEALLDRATAAGTPVIPRSPDTSG